MIRRHRSHKIADQAVSRVQKVFSDCGWASEEIRQDYGDDLLVQPDIGGRLDDNRLWIQVKGTEKIHRYQLKNGLISYPVERRHFRKWVRSADLSVFILWDLVQDIGYWAIPLHQRTELELRRIRRKELKLYLDNDDLFSVEAAQYIAWQGRIKYFEDVLTEGQKLDFQIDMLGQDTSSVYENFPQRTVVAACDLLRILNLWDGKRVCDRYTSSYQEQMRRAKAERCGDEFSDDDPGEDDDEFVSALIAFLNVFAVETNDLMPPMSISNVCPKVLLILMSINEKD